MSFLIPVVITFKIRGFYSPFDIVARKIKVPASRSAFLSKGKTGVCFNAPSINQVQIYNYLCPEYIQTLHDSLAK